MGRPCGEFEAHGANDIAHQRRTNAYKLTLEERNCITAYYMLQPVTSLIAGAAQWSWLCIHEIQGLAIYDNTGTFAI